MNCLPIFTDLSMNIWNHAEQKDMSPKLHIKEALTFVFLRIYTVSLSFMPHRTK